MSATRTCIRASPWSTSRSSPARCRSTPARWPPAPAAKAARSASPPSIPRSTSTAPMPARPCRPMPGRWRSTPPTASAMSRSTTTRATGRPRRRFRPVDRAQRHRAASAWRRARCRSAGRSAPAMRARTFGRPLRPAISRACYVRGDVVVPVGPTLALTAGVGYEDIQASQLDFVRDANGVPGDRPERRPTPDPTAPRLLTYDQTASCMTPASSGGRRPRTELQARAGHRYGGTTFIGSLDAPVQRPSGRAAPPSSTGCETFGHALINDLSACRTILMSTVIR